MMNVVTPSSKLGPLLGEPTSKALQRAFGHETVDDLLRHYPRRYAERGTLTPLSRLTAGDHVTLLARIADIRNYSFGPRGRKWRTEVVVTDGEGRIGLTFFNQKWRFAKIEPGTLGLFSGKVSEFNGKPQLTHPDFELLADDDDVTASRLARPLIALYPATSAFPSWKIAASIELVLDAVGPIEDLLPGDVVAEQRLWNPNASFNALHRPRSWADVTTAQRRFKFEEAFVIQTVLAQRRRVLERQDATPRPARAGGVREAFTSRLPFDLTAGQESVGATISADLGRAHPMHRLLQGEVGSGKTIVALLAMLQVVDAGGQAALLAPTEVLAQQHARAFEQLVGDLVRVRLLTGSLGVTERKIALLDAQSGAADLIVGTHALIQETVGFADLGLVVVDEQHRFGVEQRAALTLKAERKPHVLVMTATPIPRTVAMTAFGDLETSVLAELPRGRQPIQTHVVPVAERPAWFARVWERIREEVEAGGQAYVVCSRIGDDDSDDDTTHTVVSTFRRLNEGPLAGLRMGMLHGRLAPKDKDEVMTAFAGGEIDVLVSTTVVEVGVDVPEATVMAVLDAERFGIAQLHQLRGRVGRGTKPGLCLLVTAAESGSAAAERLAAVAATNDGFELSHIDVELRREGDVLGTSQSGFRSSLRLLSVLRDEDVIVAARKAADRIVTDDPPLARHRILAEAVSAFEDVAEYLEKT